MLMDIGKLKMNNVAFVMYSHSSYKDVWPLFFGQTEKYLPVKRLGAKRYVFLDKISENIPSDFTQILYSDTLSYVERVSHCLSQLEEEFIFFQHEDMFLYNDPDVEKLKQIPELLKNSPASFVKLIKGGTIKDISTKYEWLKFIPSYSNWIFSVQPSIWKKSDLINLLVNFCGRSIWELETECQEWCRKNHITGFYTFVGDENQRGQLHWDSKIFPYIATAIVKGKWNYSEYKKELDKLFYEYNIDANLRGTV